MKIGSDNVAVNNGFLPVRYGPYQKNCNISGIFRSGKGDRPLLPERPAGCCAQKGSVPFSFPCVTSMALQFFCDEPYNPR